MALWLHPSVTSTIVDNSGFYATAAGQTVAFFPGFFEKGKDNELITVEGPTDADLVKKFGKVDAVEYGQNHLNLVNWLTAGGSAVVMRCLPDNAKYAHAILEVLTKKVKVSGMSITVDGNVFELVRDYNVEGAFAGLVYFNEDGEKVQVCSAVNADKVCGLEALGEGEAVEDLMFVEGTIASDEDREVVNVVPKIVYVPSGVSKVGTIQAYINNKQGQVNADGYTRNILGYFIPEGRGAAFYNDTRISLTLASNFDNTYDFRVYSLTIEAYDKVNEEWGIIYGPYYVSFDETARDFSDETMFIGDVLERYCDEFKFVAYGADADEDSGLLNKGFYNAAMAIAGDDANLRRVDVLSCKEYYSEADEEFSHIHGKAIVNGGTLTLRKDIIKGSKKLYVEGGVPIVGASLVIAGSVYRTVVNVNVTTGEVEVDEAFVNSAYTATEIAQMESEAEQAYAETVSVVAENDAIIYVNDIDEPAAEATIKPVDDAIERITGKKYKLYLNKNGADFRNDQIVTITMEPLKIFNKGDNPDTNDSVTIVSSTVEGVLPGEEYQLDDITGNWIYSKEIEGIAVEKKLVHVDAIDEIPAQGTEGEEGYVPAVPAVAAHWEFRNGETVYASSTTDAVRPSDATFAGISMTFNENIEESYLTIIDAITFKAKISEIDDMNDAIVIDFTDITNTDAAAKLIKNFADFDFTEDPSDELSDGASGGSNDSLIKIEAVKTAVSPFAKCLSLSEGDYAYMQYGSAGDVDTVDGASRAQVATTRKNLLIKAFRGSLNEAITMKKLWPIDIVLDANYDVTVKNAINELTLSREDFMFLCDTGFCATPDQAIEKRNNSLVYNNRYTAIFTQDMRVYDEYTSKNIKVTPTYFLAKKIPYVDRAYGIHYAFVGPNRGEVEGMVAGTLSWNPTEAQKEKLYKKQLNYIQHDPNHLMFMGQLTSQKKASSLSDIPNVRALLIIRRNMEALMEEYYFERINENLLSAMSAAGNNYMAEWVSNGTLSEANVSVYASEYDMKQKLVRVQVELKFTSFLERVVMTFTVK